MNPDAQQPNAQHLPPTEAPSYNQPISSETGENARISSPKYWLTVYGIFALYVLLEIIDKKVKILSLVVLLAWLVVLIICYRTISKLKVSGTDSLTKEEKYKMVFFMSVDPVLAQAFFYYRFKKSLPQTARIALKIGWKVFFLQVIPAVVGFFVLVVFLATPALQKNSWGDTNVNQFRTVYANLSSDYTNISNDFASITYTPAVGFQSFSPDSTLLSQTQADCTKLQTDASSLKLLPEYPVSATNTQLHSAATTLSQAASNCLTGLSQNNVSLIDQSVSDLVQGKKDLGSVNTTIQVTK
jgi:uncharacterized membrane protein YhaH (DUF805 family)